MDIFIPLHIIYLSSYLLVLKLRLGLGLRLKKIYLSFWMGDRGYMSCLHEEVQPTGESSHS